MRPLVMALGIRSFLRSIEKLRRVSSRGIAMSSTNLQKALEKLEQNPYYDKYAQRIAELQRTSPEEFLQRVENTSTAARRDPPSQPGDLASVDTRQFSSVLNPKEQLGGDVKAEDKKLEDIFKIDLVKDKDASEIQIIWEEYHKNKEVISATIPLGLYTSIRDKMKEFPTFLLPLPRSQGYEFVLCQNHCHSVHFTPLLAYQVHKENAPECLTMVHYTELKDKGIILMRGEYDKNVLSGKEAQCLANQFQLYYNGSDEAKSTLLETFSKQPNSFKHMDLISQLENITLS